MASVASVAVELYEFCFFLLPFPHGLWEAVPQSKVSCLMYGLRSTAVHNLFKMCLSELMELTERPTNTSISHGYVQVLVEASIANPWVFLLHLKNSKLPSDENYKATHFQNKFAQNKKKQKNKMCN
uniref:Uncharacterized protein n=1 Tax=Athene cunicularia TaxID=194338 RepID=A0A663ME72_ATHCN